MPYHSLFRITQRELADIKMEYTWTQETGDKGVFLSAFVSKGALLSCWPLGVSALVYDTAHKIHDTTRLPLGGVSGTCGKS